MEENIKKNFEQQAENENKSKKIKERKERKYATKEEYIEANRKNTEARNKVKSQFKKQLKEEGSWGQLYLIRILDTTILPDELVQKILKIAKKALPAKSGARDNSISAEEEE